MSSKNWQLTTPLPLLQKMLVVSLICLFNKSESNRMLLSRMHNRSCCQNTRCSWCQVQQGPLAAYSFSILDLQRATALTGSKDLGLNVLTER